MQSSVARRSVLVKRQLQVRGLLTDLRRTVALNATDSAGATASHLHSTATSSPSFTRVPNAPSTAAAEAANFGSVRRSWRPFLESLYLFPSLQNVALKTASYFTEASEIEFHLPRDFHAKYQVAELLGEGAFGRVHRVVAMDPRTDLDLAVKIIPKSRVVNLTDYQGLQQEGRMMVLLGGTLNVVHFFGAYEDEESVYLVMEHCVGGDAFARLQKQSEKKGEVDFQQHEAIVAGYMSDILHVVWQCHLLRILHGDLKLENFLFADSSETSPLKLTDFGGASFLEDGERLYEVRGTPLYTAPEVLQGKDGYSFPSDLWSCGVILYRLLSGRFPFEGTLLDERIMMEEVDYESLPWSHISPEAKDLVQKLLNRDVTERWTAEQALQHPWVRQSAGDPTGTPSPSTMALLDGTMVQRLQLYRSFNSFQIAVFAEIARRLPVEHKEDLVVLFTEVSRHGDQQVGIPEFADCLAQGGYHLTLSEVKTFLSHIDLDGDGFLSLDEFCAAFIDWSVLQRQSPTQWNALVTDVFTMLDHDQDGQLSVDDLAQLAPFANGSNPGDRKARHSFRSDMKRCFRHADLNANGWLDLHEFQSMLHIQLRAYEHFARRVRVVPSGSTKAPMI
ncbi:hypothetical protein Poli38472_007113 [Pythium oligandrum]|uniref:Calmodulin n=1 Tax=Pythium oligandrum TaxID=41045 RepID=A0A8K1C9M5_PYTOL|nr:hypothetical protein Poli38472_007113 [Pythium oligandrum]|eukprot:TMW58968.1 hypothetical protein Poli38472_007113 [Pythium oligandrum]